MSDMMSISRSLWVLGCVARPSALSRVGPTVSKCQVNSKSQSVTISTSARRQTEDVMSSSESESDSDLEASGIHDSPLHHDADEDRVGVLKVCLHMVRQRGWCTDVLAEGAKEVGLEGKEVELFPNGAGDLVNLFEQHCNEKLYQFMEKQKRSGLVGSKAIQPSIEYRLKMLSPYINTWPQAMALKVYPPVAATALENLSLMVDDIWFVAGDRSTDINWYTKRTILAAIYTSTELFMIQDESDGFEATWRFLDHQLQGVHDVSKRVEQIGGMGRGFLDLVTAGLQNLRENVQSSIGEMTGKK